MYFNFCVLCARVLVRVSMVVYIHVCLHLEARGWHLMSSLIAQLFILRQGLLLNSALTVPASFVRSHLCLLSVGNPGSTQYPTWLLYAFWKPKLQLPCLHGEGLHVYTVGWHYLTVGKIPENKHKGTSLEVERMSHLPSPETHFMEIMYVGY